MVCSLCAHWALHCYQGNYLASSLVSSALLWHYFFFFFLTQPSSNVEYPTWMKERKGHEGKERLISERSVWSVSWEEDSCPPRSGLWPLYLLMDQESVVSSSCPFNLVMAVDLVFVVVFFAFFKPRNLSDSHTHTHMHPESHLSVTDQS